MLCAAITDELSIDVSGKAAVEEVDSDEVKEAEW